MSAQRLAQVWFGVTAAVVIVGLVVQVVVTAQVTDGHFPSLAGRIVNLFCFFTIQSNVIVGVTTLLLALRPDRGSTAFWTFRLDGVLAIAVTGIVFHIALADLHELRGAAAFADFMLHTASPVLCVVGWLVFGPHGRIGRRTVVLSLIFPVAWLVFTLVRGPFVDFYPYPFLDVRLLGYGQVLLTCLLVAVLFLALAAGAAALDRVLARRLPTSA